MNAASWLEGLPAPDRWRSLLLSEGPRIATVVLAVAIAVQAALIVTHLAGAGRHPAGAAASPVRSHSLDLAAITNAHLFGAAPPAPKSGGGAAPPPKTHTPRVIVT